MRLFLSPSPSARRRLAELALQIVDLVADVAARGRASLLWPLCAHHAARVVDLLLEPVVADRRRPLPAACATLRARSRRISPDMRSSCFSSSFTLASSSSFAARSAEPCRSAACRVRLRQRHRLLGDSSLLLARDLLGLLLRVSCRARRGRLLLLEPALRLAQLTERRAGLRRALLGSPSLPRAAWRRRPAARPRGLARDRDDCCSRDSRSSCRAASSACSRERALARAAALAALPGERLLPLALRFLLLPARELA